MSCALPSFCPPLLPLFLADPREEYTPFLIIDASSSSAAASKKSRTANIRLCCPHVHRCVHHSRFRRCHSWKASMGSEGAQDGHDVAPPPTPSLLDDDNAPDHAGVDGGSEALDPPPRASGPAWRHRILGILNTIFVVVVSVVVVLLFLSSSAVGALSPYSHRTSIATPPPTPTNRCQSNQSALPCAR